MFSFLKKQISSYFFEENIIDDDYHDTLAIIKGEPWKKIQGKTKDIENAVQRTGSITFLAEEFGVIDKLIPFPTKLITGQSLEVGHEVLYTLIPADVGPGEVLCVRSTVENDEYFDDTFSTPEKYFQSSVMKREGRTILFSEDDLSCNLDMVNSTFVPAVGDKVLLELDDTVHPKIVLSIRPAQLRSQSGLITSMLATKGEINKEIRFSIEVCCRGYQPVVGDDVVADVVEGKYGTCRWRALSVSPAELHPLALIPCIVEPDDKQWDIHISGSTDFGAMELGGPKKELVLIVENKGDMIQVLEGGSFRRKHSQIEAIDLSPQAIPSTGKIFVTFRANPILVGRTTEMFCFHFNGFDIKQPFQLMVIESLEVKERIKTGRYARQTSTIEDTTDQERTYGPRPFLKQRFRKLGNFKIPDKLLKAISCGANSTSNLPIEVVKELSIIYPSLLVELSPSNYAERMHLLTYLEEIAVMQSLRALALKNVFFHRRDSHLVVEIPNLAEKRPSVIVGDKIVVTQAWSAKSQAAHVGFIHEITHSTVAATFHSSFQSSYDGTACDVNFEMGSSSFPYEHNAIRKATIEYIPQVLFPEGLPKCNPRVVEMNKIHWLNQKLNEEQKCAIFNVLRGEYRPMPYLIFGPPGTGKTVTVVECILQIMRMFKESRILVCGPSNSSADLLAQRLVSGGGLKPEQLVRVIAFSRMEENIPEDLVDYCRRPTETEDENGVTKPWNYRIVVGTCTSVSKLQFFSFPRGYFTHIVVDEAGYASEPEILLPLTFLDPRSGQVVLAGDPEQLGPCIMSTYATHFKLTDSLMVRLIRRFPYARDIEGFPDSLGYNPHLVTQLVVNYRSVPEILTLPSTLFYHSVLKNTISSTEGREGEIIKAFSKVLPVPLDRKEPVTILFHGIRGENCQELDSPSWLNPHELCEALRYIRILYDIGVSNDELAVISPYRKQVTKLRQLVTELMLPIPKVGSVEELQGQERMVVILSCVRSRTTFLMGDRNLQLGFIKNPQRVNVALTRARAILIILGNPHLLCVDPCWRAVISYCVKQGSYVGCDLPSIFNSPQQVNLEEIPLIT